MLTMGSSYAVQTPLTRLVDEHAKCLARIAELEAALREIVNQCRIANDPEHMTLGLVGKIAETALDQ